MYDFRPRQKPQARPNATEKDARVAKNSPEIRNIGDDVAESTMFQAEEAKYSFDDIILNNDTYDAIKDVIAMYEKRDLIFNQWGLGTTHKQHNCVWH